MMHSTQSTRTTMENPSPKIVKWGSRLDRGAQWESFLSLWERAHLIRSFLQSQECADESALLKQLLVRIRRFFSSDFCFAALYSEDNGKQVQMGVPETTVDHLPANFVRQTLDLLSNSRVPLTWKHLSKESGFRNVAVAPIAGEVGKPMGFLMLAHGQQRGLGQGELFVLQSLAGELAWALRTMHATQRQQKVLVHVSHELKNALSVIIGGCALLREQLEPQLGRDERFELNSIDQMSQEILNLVHQLQEANLTREGKLPALVGEVNLPELLEEVFFVAREKAHAANVLLQIDSAADLPSEIATDGARLKQLLRSLIMHAIECSERRFVKLAVKRRSEVLEVTVAGIRQSRTLEQNGTRALFNGCWDPLKEQLEVLAGHMHLVRRPSQGYEVTVCLPCV